MTREADRAPGAHGGTAGNAAFTLSRDRFGRLVYRGADGTIRVGVVPVRAFPISAPADGVSLLGPDGRELAWIERPAELPAPLRELVEGELAAREFVPEIVGISAVSGFVTPCTWHVTTDRGETQFVLRGEEWIRRLSRSTLLIADQHGIHYLLRDIDSLDRTSRKLLDRFM